MIINTFKCDCCKKIWDDAYCKKDYTFCNKKIVGKTYHVYYNYADEIDNVSFADAEKEIEMDMLNCGIKPSLHIDLCKECFKKLDEKINKTLRDFILNLKNE